MWAVPSAGNVLLQDPFCRTFWIQTRQLDLFLVLTRYYKLSASLTKRQTCPHSTILPANGKALSIRGSLEEEEEESVAHRPDPVLPSPGTHAQGPACRNSLDSRRGWWDTGGRGLGVGDGGEGKRCFHSGRPAERTVADGKLRQRLWRPSPSP